ncbi:uncharacterized protein L969DRAFT_48638 [Mixia osmundae IAM 14324]|uniref:Uncharacterized protein n=1 Tax=Mixia osmundae (strain CBS 9802 / IAM 14324 / JCM 22182 / KY 12970) TaxID=764103 RepID=G7E0U7_MIXOS|nr:uncharacterized protein L969DRAFT_48638 [Mixia osmundae IAM 14324]KEI39486.1 hypothetical protein L969DRAFT_48638 [Mixia osmundae IAM 14324]GAA96457.1 hypothetical protein E5Q_03124 [Mixia osmundae IAM 14324]
MENHGTEIDTCLSKHSTARAAKVVITSEHQARHFATSTSSGANNRRHERANSSPSHQSFPACGRDSSRNLDLTRSATTPERHLLGVTSSLVSQHIGWLNPNSSASSHMATSDQTVSTGGLALAGRISFGHNLVDHYALPTTRQGNQATLREPSSGLALVIRSASAEWLSALGLAGLNLTRALSTRCQSSPFKIA